MSKVSRKNYLIGLVVVLIVVGIGARLFLSRESGVLTIEGATEVLAKPFPLGHPYQNSQGPNEVIKVLQSGEQLPFSNKHLDKDFATYEVNVDGKKGYVVFGGAFKESE